MIDETLAGARQPKAAARCERAPARSAEGQFKRQRDRGAGRIFVATKRLEIAAAGAAVGALGPRSFEF